MEAFKCKNYELSLKDSIRPMMILRNNQGDCLWVGLSNYRQSIPLSQVHAKALHDSTEVISAQHFHPVLFAFQYCFFVPVKL